MQWENVSFDTMIYNITKTRLFKYTENFTTKKRKFTDKKKSDSFHISVRNIDRGHSLEPPRRGGSNEYPQSMILSRNKKNNVYPCILQFYYIKVGFKGVKIIWACFRDDIERTAKLPIRQHSCTTLSSPSLFINVKKTPS